MTNKIYLLHLTKKAYRRQLCPILNSRSIWTNHFHTKDNWASCVERQLFGAVISWARPKK
ncbi:hypothetical protein Taro_030985 [Colocasia esculenta]|uniref:Uncharacterized protein n=1 Tax=Colocasia esculenta TaxID=4460 RepID=A0A843VQN3_COLES|nr:hypothetical protein [Colocasia esculenta]